MRAFVILCIAMAITPVPAGAQTGRWRVWAVLSSGGTSAKSEWQEFSYSR